MGAYHGAQTTQFSEIWHNLQNVMYEMYPKIDQMACDKSKLGNSLLGESEATSDSRKLLQGGSNGLKLGFVSS